MNICRGTFNFTDAIEEHTDYVAWLLSTMRELGHGVVDIRKEDEDRWAQICADSDLATAPLRVCGNAVWQPTPFNPTDTRDVLLSDKHLTTRAASA